MGHIKKIHKISNREKFYEKIDKELLKKNSNNEYKEGYAFLGELLHDIRIENNFSIEELSEKTGISIDDLKKYESSLQIPDYSILKKITNTLNIDLLQFSTRGLMRLNVFDITFTTSQNFID